MLRCQTRLEKRRMAVRSMTGYGSASTELPDHRLSVELRSVNHRFADVRLHLPAELAAEEGALRRRLLERVRRGRLELGVRLESIPGVASERLNRPLVTELLRAAETLRQDFGVAGEPDLGMLLRVPGILGETAEVLWGESEREALERTVDGALDALDAERRREGELLRQELSARLAAMADLVERIRAQAALVPDRLRRRLLERLAALGAEVALEPTRVAQEAVLLAERSDVTEELVRLAGHVAAARELLDRPDGEPLGKRLDFLVQEIHREVNTISSKAGELEVSRHALALKAETEKVREQVQNLE